MSCNVNLFQHKMCSDGRWFLALSALTHLPHLCLSSLFSLSSVSAQRAACERKQPFLMISQSFIRVLLIYNHSSYVVNSNYEYELFRTADLASSNIIWAIAFRNRCFPAATIATATPSERLLYIYVLDLFAFYLYYVLHCVQVSRPNK